MIIKTRGICLHTRKYAETSVIAEIYTEEKGLQSYIISSVRTPKPRVHPSLLQPGSLLDMVAYFRTDGGLFRTKEIRSAYTYRRIPFELPRGSVALFTAEVLLKVLRESEPAGDLFGFVNDFLVFVDTSSAGLANLPAYFLVRLMEYFGFQPEQPNFGAPHYFDISQGHFLPEEPNYGRFAPPEVSAFLLALGGAPLGAVPSISAGREVRTSATNTLLEYFQVHLERFSGVTSHRVFAEVLRA